MKGVGTVFASYNVPFVEGLTLKTSWGGDFTSNEFSRFVDGTTATGASTPSQKGAFSRQYGKRFRSTGTTSISYNKQINDDHTLSVGLFNEIVKANSNSFFFTGYGLGGPFENEAGITPGNNTNGFIPQVGGNMTDGTNAESVIFRGSPSALLSYFTMINYGYKDRYFRIVAASTVTTFALQPITMEGIINADGSITIEWSHTNGSSGTVNLVYDGN